MVVLSVVVLSVVVVSVVVVSTTLAVRLADCVTVDGHPTSVEEIGKMKQIVTQKIAVVLLCRKDRKH